MSPQRGEIWLAHLGLAASGVQTRHHLGPIWAMRRAKNEPLPRAWSLSFAPGPVHARVGVGLRLTGYRVIVAEQKLLVTPARVDHRRSLVRGSNAGSTPHFLTGKSI